MFKERIHISLTGWFGTHWKPTLQNQNTQGPKRNGQVQRSCTYLLINFNPETQQQLVAKTSGTVCFPGCFDHKISPIWHQLSVFCCFPYSTTLSISFKLTQLDFAILGGHLFNLQKKQGQSHELIALGCFLLSFGIQLHPKKKTVLNVLRGSGQQPAKVTSQKNYVRIVRCVR